MLHFEYIGFDGLINAILGKKKKKPTRLVYESGDPSKLSDRQINEIYKRDIEPHFKARSEKRPVVYFIGGQPGAGKSTLQKALARSLGSAMVLDGDELMDYNPHYHNMARIDDTSIPDGVNESADIWWDMLCRRALQKRCNVVISSPLKGHTWDDTMRMFKENGYYTAAYFLAVPSPVSQQGIVHRYWKGRMGPHGHGRWIPARGHDKLYDSLPDTAERYTRHTFADALHVARRSGEVVYTLQRDRKAWLNTKATGPAAGAGSIGAAISAERHRPWTQQEIDNFQADQRDICRMVASRKDWLNVVEKIGYSARNKLNPSASTVLPQMARVRSVRQESPQLHRTHTVVREVPISALHFRGRREEHPLHPVRACSFDRERSGRYRHRR